MAEMLFYSRHNKNLTQQENQQNFLSGDKQTDVTKPLRAYGLFAGSIEDYLRGRPVARPGGTLALVIAVLVLLRQAINQNPVLRRTVTPQYLGFPDADARVHFNATLLFYAIYVALVVRLFNQASGSIRELNWLTPLQVRDLLHFDWIRLSKRPIFERELVICRMVDGRYCCRAGFARIRHASIVSLSLSTKNFHALLKHIILRA